MGDSNLLLAPGNCEAFGALEAEDDLDAFNDETFGGAAAEWEEDTHEHLAELTEKEREAMHNANEFFDFGSDEGEALEPEAELNGGHRSEEPPSSALRDRLSNLSLEVEVRQPDSQPEIAASTRGGGGHFPPASDTSSLQSSFPPATSLPAPSASLAAGLPNIPAYLTLGLTGGVPLTHQLQQQLAQEQRPLNMQHLQQPQQQLLLTPSHFQQQQEPLQDPAIMSFRKVPSHPVTPMAVVHALPGHFNQMSLQTPGGGFPSGSGTAPPPAAHLIPPMLNSFPATHHPHQVAVSSSSSGGAHLFPPPPATPSQQQLNAVPPQQQQASLFHQPPPPHLKPGNAGFPFPGGASQQQQSDQPPGFVPGLKTMQDLEQELLFGKSSGAGGGHGLAHQHHHINPAARNLNYPGMRDRQQQQAPLNNIKPGGRQDGGALNNQPHHHQGMRHTNRQHHSGGENMGFNNKMGMRDHNRNAPNHFLDNGNFHHPQNFNNHHQQQNFNNRGGQNQQQPFANFGGKDNANFANNSHYQNRQRENQSGPTGPGPHGAIGGFDEDPRFVRDSATRRDLMPGHVHVLGILRHSRSRRDYHGIQPRHNQGIQQRRRHFHDGAERGSKDYSDDDGCLGREAPLLNPTGDPLLDAKLEREQAELARRCRYFDETEDDYAGLMSGRDKQFIINIQLSQLKCDNPYVDDYYYTMYTAQKESKLENGTRLLLNSLNTDHDQEYVPTQFENSLGKLQVVTVKAPRQIIDVGVMKSTENAGASGQPEGSPITEETSKTQTKKPVDYKQLLLYIERVFCTLLEVETHKLKLSAIPTGAPLREQVTGELTTLVQTLAMGINKAPYISQFLQVRKGRVLLSRSLAHLPTAAASKICQEITANLHFVCKDQVHEESIWPHLVRFINQASLGILESSVSSLLADLRVPQNGWLQIILAQPMGISTILSLIYRASTAAKRGQEKISVAVWREVIVKIVTLLQEDDMELGQPLLLPPPIDIGFLLTLPAQQMATWEAFLANVEKMAQDFLSEE